jgi:hypothetical protein
VHRGLVAAFQGLDQTMGVLQQKDAVGVFNMFLWKPLQLGHEAAFVCVISSIVPTQYELATTQIGGYLCRK